MPAKTLFKPIDQHFLEAFSRGGTIFVGSGMSIPAGMPTWRELIDPLRRDIDDAVSEQTSLLDIAELYSVQHGRPALVAEIKKRIGHTVSPTKAHHLLINLPIQRIFTTNFDNLLEAAASDNDIRQHVVVAAQDLSVTDSSGLVIVKLHGDINHSDSLVISAHDYYSYFTSRPALADLIKVELQTRTVLFLGYSLSDINLGMILGRIGHESGTMLKKRYSVQFQPSALVQKALDQRGVQVISIDAEPNTPDGNAAFEDWLRTLDRELIKHDRRRDRDYLANATETYGLHNGLDRIPEHKQTMYQLAARENLESGLLSDEPLIVISGESGVGKTQLAALVATTLRRRTADSVVLSHAYRRVVWIAAQDGGEARGRTLEQVLDVIARSLEAFSLVAGASNDLEKKRRDVESLLSDRKAVVVIDDLRDDWDASDLLKWLGQQWPRKRRKSKIIVTARSTALRGWGVAVSRLIDSESIQFLREQAHSMRLMKVYRPGLSGDHLAQMAKLGRGNPQIMRLAVVVVAVARSPLVAVDVLSRMGERSNEEVFDALLAATWEKLDSDARAILTTLLIFPLSQPVAMNLLHHSVGLSTEQFDSGIRQCIDCGLIDRDAATEEVNAPAVLLKYLRSHHSELTNSTRDMAYERLAKHLIVFLTRTDVIRREEIEEPYWNALVRPEMAKVDPYWPVISQVLRWAEGCRNTDHFVTELVLLLVHYMDSRFLNTERLHYVHAAIGALQRAGRTREEALLHADALGWTYVEEGDLDIAQREIKVGLELAIRSGYDDVATLAKAWQARVASLADHIAEARDLIAEASGHADTVPAWISMRVQMTAGDIELTSNNPARAITCYQTAQDYAELYGDEGGGYQTGHRLALALLRNQDASHAKLIFQQLAEDEHVSIGRLYGQYGLALVEAADESRRQEAKDRLNMLRHEIRRRSKKNMLLHLAEKTFIELFPGT